MGFDADLGHVWSLLPGETACPKIDLTGTAWSSSAFEVQRIADLSIGAAIGSAIDLAASRGRGAPTPTLDHSQALTAFSGYLEVDGHAPPKWADLSGTYRTADDRFIQLHCNFPHHAAGVVEYLDTAPSRSAVADAISKRIGSELEEDLIGRGMIAALCRTIDEWSTHPHHAATLDLPLLSCRQLAEAPPRQLGGRDAGGPGGGVRVVDASRVLAGPVAGQTLAGFGSDVLRVGAAHLPSVDTAVMSTGFGKRNAFIDLTTGDGQTTMQELIVSGNVVIDAYRPGALGARGFEPEQIADLAPGTIVVQLCAFDWVGPWAGRRGFDSIVQSTTGIASAGGTAAGGEGPLPLPVQALDYATGFLAAFAALRMIRHQQQVGGSWLVRLSLLRTRNWLLRLGGPVPFTPEPLPDPAPWLHRVESDFGRIEAPAPIGGSWDLPPAPLGSSPAVWRPKTQLHS
jgi:hypothetical protein